MTKEEYKSQLQERRDQLAHLEKQISILSQAYIMEHAEFWKGDKVALIVNERPHPFKDGNKIPASRTEAYVMKVFEYKGSIQYRFWKTKKDGSVSSHELYQNSWDCMELIERAKLQTP